MAALLFLGDATEMAYCLRLVALIRPLEEADSTRGFRGTCVYCAECGNKFVDDFGFPLLAP